MGNYSFFSFVIALMLAVTIILLPVSGEDFESVDDFYEGVIDGFFYTSFPAFLTIFMILGGISIAVLDTNPRKIFGIAFLLLFSGGLLYLLIKILESIEVETTQNVLRIVQYF